MNKTIVIATGNPHKAQELRAILGEDYTVKTIADLGIDIDIIEDGQTFEDNALIKVRALIPYAGDAIIMGDDSGLCVDALDGGPGIYSARYAGPGCTFDDNNRKLLKTMASVADEDRGATFVCCAALRFPDGEEWTGRGEVRGTITRALSGIRGFGYDPVFLVDGLGKTYAELSEDEKNAMSHRAKATALVMAKLAEKEA